MRTSKFLWMVAAGGLAVAVAAAQADTPADTVVAMAIIDSTARPISLDEALTMARKNAPAAIQAEGRVRTARADVRSSVAAFIPNVSLSLGGTRQYSNTRTRVDPNTGQIIILPNTPWSYSAGLSANVAVFEGGARFFDYKQARASVTSATANQLAQHYFVDLSVKQAYFAVLAARESENAARAELDQAVQQRRVAVLKVRSGSATKSDSLRAVIQVNNANLAVLQAQNDLRSANAALTRAVGATELMTASESEDVERPVVELDHAALAALVDVGPTVQAAQADLDAARALHSSAWTTYLPSITASYGRSGTGSGEDMWFTGDDLGYSGALRLGVSFPIFNQYGRESQVVRSDVAEDNANAGLRDARLAARENLTRFLGDYQTALQQVDAQTASVAAAEEDLRVQQRRYSVGEGTLLDLLASQTQLVQARETLIRARYDQRIARAQLEALVGRDL